MNMEILSKSVIISCFVLTLQMKNGQIHSVGHSMVPEPRGWHATTKCQDKVWLYGGCPSMKAFHDLHELNMHSCTWTQVETLQIQSQANAPCTLSMMSNNKFVLHGGKNDNLKRLSDTWILDLETKTWK